MTVKHTPTNWNFKYEFAKHYSITYNGYWIGRMRGQENAQLVSAAPYLLEALSKLTEMYCQMIYSGDCGNWNPEDDIEVKEARAAIAKATGGAA